MPPKERVREGAHPAPEEPAGYGSAAGVYDRFEVTVPDIGEFTDVPVIEVHVRAGDTVAAEDPLLTLESDKATMDVPAPAAGTVAQVLVEVGDTVSQGSVIAHLTTGAAAPTPQAGSPAPATAAGTAAAAGGAAGQRPARGCARRGAGARRRPGRLHRGVPGRRPRPAGRPGRSVGRPWVGCA